MSKGQIFDLLYELRLSGFSAELEHQLQHPSYTDLPFTDRVLQLLQAESTRRYRNKIDRLLKAAQFKYQADPEQVDYQQSRNLDKSEILGLLSCDWVSRHQNLILTGASGTGKTWLACAFGVAAVRKELSTAYFRAGRLTEMIKYSRLDGTIGKLRKRIAHLDLLVIDDFALSPMSTTELTDLFEIIEDRSAHSSTIMTAQRAPEEWYDFIGDPLLADAFMDRIRSRAHFLQLKGRSMR